MINIKYFLEKNYNNNYFETIFYGAQIELNNFNDGYIYVQKIKKIKHLIDFCEHRLYYILIYNFIVKLIEKKNIQNK